MSSPSPSPPKFSPYYVVCSPDRPSSYSNCVFFSLETPLLGGVVELRVPRIDPPNPELKQHGIFIHAATHYKVSQGRRSIGLSAIQRGFLGVQLDDEIEARFLGAQEVKEVLPKLTSLVLRVHSAREELKRLNIYEDRVLELLHIRYDARVFYEDQVYLMEYDSEEPLCLTVEATEAEDGGGKGVLGATFGVLSAETVVQVLPPEPPVRLFKFHKSSRKIRQMPCLNANFSLESMNIGGLDFEFQTLFRRAFASRLMSSKLRKELGTQHVRGILLFGPPGTGKTLVARQIGKMLTSVEPKIVNGPEILNKFVGESERKIRELFEDAEKDFKANGDSADLHLIIFDEIDALTTARGTHAGDAGVRDTIVNQLLTKLDGIEQYDNFLVIGMTNRRDLMDPALLRPGRLEVQIEIHLPDEPGRRQIFTIHTSAMRKSGRLDPGVSMDALAAITKNYTGAEIEAVVKSASSFALYKSVQKSEEKGGAGDGTTKKAPLQLDEKSIRVTQEAFDYALDEVRPLFGVDEEDLKSYCPAKYVAFSDPLESTLDQASKGIQLVRKSEHVRLQSILLYGISGAGKTSTAAKLALDSGFPYIRVIAPHQFVGISEAQKVREIAQVFEDAYKSPEALIVVDQLERLLDWVPVGPRFSSSVLQTLLVTFQHASPGCRLAIVSTTSRMDMVESLGFEEVLTLSLEVPEVRESREVWRLLKGLADGDERKAAELVPPELRERVVEGFEVDPVGVKRVLQWVEEGRAGDKGWMERLGVKFPWGEMGEGVADGMGEAEEEE